MTLDNIILAEASKNGLIYETHNANSIYQFQYKGEKYKYDISISNMDGSSLRLPYLIFSISLDVKFGYQNEKYYLNKIINEINYKYLTIGRLFYLEDKYRTYDKLIYKANCIYSNIEESSSIIKRYLNLVLYEYSSFIEPLINLSFISYNRFCYLSSIEDDYENEVKHYSLVDTYIYEKFKYTENYQHFIKNINPKEFKITYLPDKKYYSVETDSPTFGEIGFDFAILERGEYAILKLIVFITVEEKLNEHDFNATNKFNLLNDLNTSFNIINNQIMSFKCEKNIIVDKPYLTSKFLENEFIFFTINICNSFYNFIKYRENDYQDENLLTAL